MRDALLVARNRVKWISRLLDEIERGRKSCSGVGIYADSASDLKKLGILRVRYDAVKDEMQFALRALPGRRK